MARARAASSAWAVVVQSRVMLVMWEFEVVTTAVMAPLLA